MSNVKYSVEEILEIVAQFSKQGLGELLLEQDQFKLHLTAKQPLAAAAVTQTSSSVQAVSSVESVSPVESALVAGTLVTAPIIGTFYASPAPEKPPFVVVGSRVKKGDVLFIIESMKLMNEVHSDVDGEVVQILCLDGDTVEYGQEILVIN